MSARRRGASTSRPPACELDRLYFAAKTNANFSGNPRRHGLPAIQGVIVLCDADNGCPLAVMDSMEVTARRTAAATAVAAKWLARPDASTVTVCGCGSQGREQLRALARVLPLRRAYAFDLDEAKARAFARDLSAELGFEITPARDHAEAVRSSDVCVTCTPSRAPFLMRDHVAPGTFVAAVGADSSDKQELDPRLMAEAVVVVDVLDQCASIGDLHHALEAGVLTREAVHAELADVVTGRKPGRRSDAGDHGLRLHRDGPRGRGGGRGRLRESRGGGSSGWPWISGAERRSRLGGGDR